jgi:hypothetical protein
MTDRVAVHNFVVTGVNKARTGRRNLAFKKIAYVLHYRKFEVSNFGPPVARIMNIFVIFVSSSFTCSHSGINNCIFFFVKYEINFCVNAIECTNLDSIAYYAPRLLLLGYKPVRHVTVLNTVGQLFSNFFQVGTTFISQNVLRTTLLLSPLKANLSFFKCSQDMLLPAY